MALNQNRMMVSWLGVLWFWRSRRISRKGCGTLLKLVENVFCCFPQFQWFPQPVFGPGMGGFRGEGDQTMALMNIDICLIAK